MTDHPPPTSSNGRLGAAVFFVGLVAVAGTVVAVVLGWRLIGSPIEQLDRLSTATSDALVTLADNLTLTRDTITQVQAGLSTTGELLGDSTESIDQVRAGLSDTAESLEGPIPDSLFAVEQALPELIATAAILEPTLGSLSFLGVDYDPEVPLSQTLERLRGNLRPLTGELRADGELLASLASETETIAGQTNELATTMDGIAEALAEAETLLSEEVRSAEAAQALLAVERAQLPLLERRARVVLVIYGAAIGLTQLALVLLGWSHWRSGSS